MQFAIESVCEPSASRVHSRVPGRVDFHSWADFDLPDFPYSKRMFLHWAEIRPWRWFWRRCVRSVSPLLASVAATVWTRFLFLACLLVGTILYASLLCLVRLSSDGLFIFKIDFAIWVGCRVLAACLIWHRIDMWNEFLPYQWRLFKPYAYFMFYTIFPMDLAPFFRCFVSYDPCEFVCHGFRMTDVTSWSFLSFFVTKITGEG